MNKKYIVRLSDEEREEYGRLEPGSPSILQLVNEGRGPR